MHLKKICSLFVLLNMFSCCSYTKPRPKSNKEFFKQELEKFNQKAENYITQDPHLCELKLQFEKFIPQALSKLTTIDQEIALAPN